MSATPSESDPLDELGDLDLFVPDDVARGSALARTTDLGIGAHPDDLEFLMLAPIGLAADDPERWFTGITCTDGAGSARTGRFADLTDAQMVETRRAEQCAAAEVGRYSAVVQLARPSSEVRGAGFDALVADLARLVAIAAPNNVYTHNLADKHTTHVAVGLATVLAIRSLDPARRPHRLVGVEGWRDLDWLPDHEKILLDVSAFADLSHRLAACFPSQIEGGKRYDLAEEGRRRANATMREPRAADDAEQLSVAMDLSPLIHNDELDPILFVTRAVDRFRDEVDQGLRTLLDPSG